MTPHFKTGYTVLVVVDDPAVLGLSDPDKAEA
jgi:hypothetical protein